MKDEHHCQVLSIPGGTVSCCHHGEGTGEGGSSVLPVTMLQ